jgi:chitinase
MRYMPRVTINGVLESGRAVTELPPIPAAFWQKNSWLATNPLLAARPPVGGADGIQPDSPNDRVMEAFGSNDFTDPFMAVDSQINGPKGRVMARRAPTAIDNIEIQAAVAVASDAQGDVDELLQMVRVVSRHSF